MKRAVAVAISFPRRRPTASQNACGGFSCGGYEPIPARWTYYFRCWYLPGEKLAGRSVSAKAEGNFAGRAGWRRPSNGDGGFTVMIRTCREPSVQDRIRPRFAVGEARFRQRVNSCDSRFRETWSGIVEGLFALRSKGFASSFELPFFGERAARSAWAKVVPIFFLKPGRPARSVAEKNRTGGITTTAGSGAGGATHSCPLPGSRDQVAAHEDQGLAAFRARSAAMIISAGPRPHEIREAFAFSIFFFL